MCLTDTRSAYYNKKANEVKAWSSLRDKLFKVSIETQAPPSQTICGTCSCSLDAIFRCHDCMVGAVYCEGCLLAIHKTVKLHHPEQWKASPYIFMMTFLLTQKQLTSYYQTE